MNYTIATLGGHSALEICLGAKKRKFRTLVIAEKGREKTYTKYYRKLFDKIIIVDKFHDLTDKKIFNLLKEKNSIFIPHRYCQVYCDLEKLENDFPVPIFGNKHLLKYEEREGEINQYQILKKAQVEFPKQYCDPQKIDRLVIVKVKEAARGYERAFFFAANFRDYQKKGGELVKQGKITKESLQEAVIEEYLVGTQINFNFFYSPISDSLELLGTDARRQTNLDGYIRLPAGEQLKISQYLNPSYIETGHFAVTVKESLLEKAYGAAEKITSCLKTMVPPGMIGPFALQCAIIPGPPKEKLVVYDLSLRMPGSPGTIFTPYSQYLYGKSISFGERIAMEIERALEINLLKDITT